MGQGIGILVSKIPKETSASYSLREPSEVAPLPTATSNSAQTTYFSSVLLCSEKCERKPAEILHRKVTVGAAVVAKKKELWPQRPKCSLLLSRKARLGPPLFYML
jgi:hypothetical protein